MKDAYIGDKELDIMARYASNRNASIKKLIRRAFGLDGLSQPKKMLEFGAGKGEFIDAFHGQRFLDTYAVELCDDYREDLGRRHKTAKRLEEFQGVEFDFIFLVDVLEHIEDDRAMLAQLRESLAPDGRLFIYVPAGRELFSRLDKNVGHYRRYNKKDLLAKVSGAGFDIIDARFHEFLGYFIGLYNRFFYRYDALEPRLVGLYDRIIVPTTNLIERFWRVPRGKSLYVIADKTRDHT